MSKHCCIYYQEKNTLKAYHRHFFPQNSLNILLQQSDTAKHTVVDGRLLLGAKLRLNLLRPAARLNLIQHGNRWG